MYGGLLQVFGSCDDAGPHGGIDGHFSAGSVVHKAVDTHCLLSSSNPTRTVALIQARLSE